MPLAASRVPMSTVSMIATHGASRHPITAPMAAPVQAASDTGVSRTRCLPNSWSRFVIELPTYHGLHRPWPIVKTLGSLCISQPKPLRMASP